MKKVKNLILLLPIFVCACSRLEEPLSDLSSNLELTKNKVITSSSYVDIKKSTLFKGEKIKKSINTSGSIKTFSSESTDFRFKSKQWHLRSTNTFSAWEQTKGNKDLIVAVIDGGVDYNHPDLKNRVIKGPDFGNTDEDPMDLDGHGTHVAGIIAANGNVKGIAPNVKIMALKVFESNDSPVKNNDQSDKISKAIVYATENGASIINMSLGSDSLLKGSVSRSKSISSAMNEAAGKGITIFTSAGNSSYSNVSAQSGVQSNLSQIPVIATDEQERISTFSTYSNLDHPKAISAPGSNIYSTIATSIACKKNSCDLPYDYKNGTSMASPVAAGVMALIESAMYDDYVRVIKELEKDSTNLQIKTFREFFHTKAKESMLDLGISIPPSKLAEQILFSYTNKDNSYLQDSYNMSYGAKRDEVFGFGIVDAGKAVKAASEVFSSVYLK